MCSSDLRHVGASGDRYFADWNPTAGSPDADVVDDMHVLRSRTRDLIANDPLAKGIVQSVVDNMGGAGFKPATTPREKELREKGVSQAQLEAFKRGATSAWRRWSESEDADARRRGDWIFLVNQANRAALTGGDSWTLPLMLNRPSSPYMLSLQVLEADQVDTPSGLQNDSTVRGGVKVGKYEQPLGAWMLKGHPGDLRYLKVDDFRFIRFLNKAGRTNLLQLYYAERPGQNRGLPLYSSSMALWDHLHNYIEAESVGARAAACISMVIKKDDPLAARQARTLLGQSTSGGSTLENLEPGSIEYLNPGEDLQIVNPQRPGSTFDPFVIRLLRLILREIGVPYEVGALDFSKANYSNMRGAQLETRKVWQCRQQTLVAWASKVWRLLLEEAWLKGELGTVNLYEHWDDLMAVRWTLPGWPSVDPEKEAKASALALELGLTTREREVANWTGLFWEDVERQRIAEEIRTKELRKEAGLEEETPAPPQDENQPTDSSNNDEGASGGETEGDATENAEEPAGASQEIE